MDPTTGIVGMVGLVALIAKLTDFGRMLTNLPGTGRKVASQLLAWAVAIAALWLYSASQYGSTVVIAGTPVDHMGAATKVLVGVTLGSAASLVADGRRAIDNTQTAAVPPLHIGHDASPDAAPPGPPTSAPVASATPPAPTVVPVVAGPLAPISAPTVMPPAPLIPPTPPLADPGPPLAAVPSPGMS